MNAITKATKHIGLGGEGYNIAHTLEQRKVILK